MTDNKKFYATAIANVLYVVIFTVIAIVFHRWWAVLVAILFQNNYKPISGN